MSLASENARTSAALSEPNLDAVPYPGPRGYVQSGNAATVRAMDADFVTTNTGMLDNVGKYPYTAVSLTTNAYIGAYIRVFSASGAAQERAIIASAADGTMTVSPSWDTNPDNTYTYVIYGIACAITKPRASQLTIEENFPTVDNALGNEPTHPLSGSLLRVLTGAAKGQIVEIISFSSGEKVATISPQLSVVPAAGNSCAIFGEQGWSTIAATKITMTMGTMLSSVNGHYDGLCVEIRRCDSHTVAVGQIRKISTQVGSILTLEKPWDHIPSTPFAYAIFGGWGCEFVNVGEAASALTQISTPSGAIGVRESWGSITPTAYNKNGTLVAERQILNLYGADAVDRAFNGKALTSDHMYSQFYRFNLVAFSYLQGGVRSRLCEAFSAASSAAKKEYTVIEKLEATPTDYATTVGAGSHPSEKVIHLTATYIKPLAGYIVTTTDTEDADSQHVMILSPSTSTFQVRSTSAFDVSPNGGAYSVTIAGIDNSQSLLSETITLNSTTNVATTNTDWLGVNSITTTTAGALKSNGGTLQVWDGTDEYYCTVAPGEGQQRRLVYYVSSQTKILIHRIHFTLSPGVAGGIQTVKVVLYKYHFDSGVQNTILTISLDTLKITDHEETFSFPLLVESSSVFWAEVTEASGGGGPILTGHIELVETGA